MSKMQSGHAAAAAAAAAVPLVEPDPTAFGDLPPSAQEQPSAWRVRLDEIVQERRREDARYADIIQQARLMASGANADQLAALYEIVRQNAYQRARRQWGMPWAFRNLAPDRRTRAAQLNDMVQRLDAMLAVPVPPGAHPMEVAEVRGSWEGARFVAATQAAMLIREQIGARGDEVAPILPSMPPL